MTPISIVIPALNEEDGIGPVLEAIAALPLDTEVIVVNDGSTDKTGERAQAAGATVVHHAASLGYGKSLKDGINAATRDTIVITDADGTYPIESIPELLTEYEKGFAMVVGARQGKEYRGSMFKHPARLALKWLVEFTTGRSIPDINSGLRIFRKDIAKQYEADLCDTFSFTTTLTLIFSLNRHPFTYVPIRYDKRIGRSKVRIVRDSLRTLQYITQCIARFNPIKLYVILCGFAVVCGLLALPLVGFMGPLLGVLTAIVTFGIGVHAISRSPVR